MILKYKFETLNHIYVQLVNIALIKIYVQLVNIALIKIYVELVNIALIKVYVQLVHIALIKSGRKCEEKLTKLSLSLSYSS